jgi:hypothetical protein
LQLAAEQYHRSISKKKLSIALDDPDKVLPRDAFGMIMVRHGEDFADDSLLGISSFILLLSSALYSVQQARLL